MIALFHGDAPCSTSIIFRDIFSCIVYKVNPLRIIAPSVTNKSLNIALRFSDNIFLFLLMFFCSFLLVYKGMPSWFSRSLFLGFILIAFKGK